MTGLSTGNGCRCGYRRSAWAAAGLITSALGFAVSAFAAEVEGQVRDRATGKAVPDAAVTVVGSGKSDRVSSSGEFRIVGVPAGPQVVKIEAPGYLPFVLKDVPFRDERPVVLNVKLRRGVAAVAGQRITADRPSRLAQTETSRRSITGDEVRRVAGARNDPILAIANTAGVKAAGFSGAPAVRGGGPNDNRYMIDGIEIGNPYHFGGLVSVFNAATIAKVDLYSGALPARYGNALSAVIDIETKPARTDSWHGLLDTNLLYTEALLHGPLGPSAGLSFAGRRSYLDVVLGPLLTNYIPAGTVLPVFTDYQGKFTLQVPGSGQVELVGIGANDSARVVLAGGGVGRGIGEIALDQGFRSTGLVWRQPLGDTTSSRFTVNYQEPFTDFKAGRFLEIYDYQFRWTLAEELAWQATEQHQIRTGLRYDTINYVSRRIQPDFAQLARNRGVPGGGGPFGPGGGAGGGGGPIPQPPTAEELEALPKKSTDTFGNQKVYATYLEDAWQVSQGLTLSLGARYDQLGSTGENKLGPRGGLSWRLDPDTTLRLAYGQQYQYPTVGQLLPGTGNPNLRAAFSKDYVAGVDRQLTDRLFGRLEIYYRNLYGLVISDQVANLANVGSGRSFGAETTLELAETDGWSGQLALTLARSFRTNRDNAEIPYDYDQPIVANLLATAPSLWGWSPSLKLRYALGRPYTPVIDRKQDVNGIWQAVRGDQNSRNFPDGYTWSARIEKPLKLWGADDSFYLEVTQQAEVLGVDYGQDYERIADPTFNRGLPPLPYLGYRLKF